MTDWERRIRYFAQNNIEYRVMKRNGIKRLVKAYIPGENECLVDSFSSYYVFLRGCEVIHSSRFSTVKEKYDSL